MPINNSATTIKMSLGTKLKVISWIDVAACTIPITTPASSIPASNGPASSTATQSASRPITMTSLIVIYITIKLAVSDCMTRSQPSDRTNSISLNGMDIIIGESIIMPMDINTLATTRSMITNGM